MERIGCGPRSIFFDVPLNSGVAMTELLSALCLVAVLEGLVLFVAPGGWKRAALQLLEQTDRQLRWFGGLILATGLLALWWLRH